MPKRKNLTSPTDFVSMEAKLRPFVASLSSINNDAATFAYGRLGTRIYKYAAKLTRAEAVDELRTYLCRRDRTATVLDMNVFQLSLELAMPEKFPPLNGTMRRALALKLACAAKRRIPPENLAQFLQSPPPVKTMKLELGLLPADDASAVVANATPKPGRGMRPVKRKRVIHPVANSQTAKAHRAAVRKRARAIRGQE